jgi:Holliday junction DNA helicase RuvA
MSIADLAAAVAGKDAGRLTRIPGVGKKTAERLLLELQGKFSVTGVATPAGGAAPSAGSDIVNALLALGYNEKEASWAAQQLPKEIDVSGGGDDARRAGKVVVVDHVFDNSLSA